MWYSSGAMTGVSRLIAGARPRLLAMTPEPFTADW
jgi:hypothetical protein